MLWVLLASKITPATADEADPVCPSAEPVRACGFRLVAWEIP